MSNPVPVCTHVKTDGVRCGSPAVSGTEFCYHHSAVKAALGKAQPSGQRSYGEFAPIPFLFPEDRASMQINFFLLLQAFNEQRIDQGRYRLMLSMLKAMAKNLGRTGSLVEASGEAVGNETASQKPISQEAVSGEAVSEPTSQKRDVGHPQQAQGNGGHVERSETSAVSLSAAWDTLLPSTIAPENCFSTNPKVLASEDLFRTNPFDTAGFAALTR